MKNCKTMKLGMKFTFTMIIEKKIKNILLELKPPRTNTKTSCRT
jgi:hypothetical protein